MSLDATVWAWKQDLPATQKIILLSLADRCGEDFTCYPSQKRLEKDTGLNIKTIKANIKKLVSAGLVSDTGRRIGRTMSVKIYKLSVNCSREDSPKTGHLEDEVSPILPESEPENGLPKLAQNRAIEPPIVEPPIEPDDIGALRFKKPTIDQINEYCLERKNKVDPEYFFDYYESKGWMIGKNKMKCWKSAIRTWERNSFTTSKPKRSVNDLSGMDYSKEDF